ncbi:MAG: multidrug ABC transporter permease [Candidatus Altiarchaeales archaeon]|nr:multidrug ABC transporter permease [Candidatus Altiarchaeales archaeon]
MIKVVYVMWLRQLKRYWRSKSRLIGSIGQSVLFLVAFGFGFSPVFAKAGEGDYMQFLAPGIISMSILFTSMFTGIEVVWDRKFGFLKETLVAPIPRYAIMLGRTLGGATIGILQGLVVFGITLVLGFRPMNWLFFPAALFFMFLMATLLTAFGTAIASKIEDMQAFPMIMNFIIMPMFFLSGALFPLEDLPAFMDVAIKLNPLTYGVDGLRWALTGANTFNVILDVGVVLLLALIVNLVGSKLFSEIEI